MAEKRKKKSKANPPCDACGASCCRYVAIEIDKPKTKRDYDHLRWYLLHENVHVLIDHEGSWLVEFKSACEGLDKVGRCTVYDIRPRICRDHGEDTHSCEYYDEPHAHHFTGVGELEAYLDEKKIDWRWKKHKKRA